MGGEKKQLHVALLPWLAFGHLNPLLHLAASLAAVGLRISYLATPRNIRRLSVDAIPPHISSNINFITLSMPSVEGLPEDAEATVDLTADNQNPLLRIALDRLQDQVKAFLAGNDPPDHLIFDSFNHWAPRLAFEAGEIPSMELSFISSHAMAFFGLPPEGVDVNDEEGMKKWWPSPESLMSLPNWIPFETKMHFRRWEAGNFYRIMFGNCPSGLSIGARLMHANRSSSAVAVRCCNEFNAEFLELLPKLYSKPVIPLGWLPPTVLPMSHDADSGSDNRRAESLEWLDGQPPKSVVFVSFGSELRLNKTAMFELAHGLELSNLSFLWLMRRPTWLSSDEGDDKALPYGFQSRTQGRGLVSFGWLPQLKIWAHKSVGSVLFHGGWGTTIESLSFGLVPVLLAGFVDQGLTAQRLVEKRIGVEIERNEDDGSFDRHGVAKALRTAMTSEEGETLRENARSMSAVLGDQTVHDKYIKNLVDFLAQSTKKTL